MEDHDQHLPAIVAGDADAFGRWAAAVEGRLRESLRPFAARVDTEAALQETLLRVWQVAPRFVADGAHNGLFRLGLRVARNLAIDELRRRRRWESCDEEAAERAAGRDLGDERGAPDPMLRRAIVLCREALPEKPAQALGARLAAGGADGDDVLAARLGMRKNTFLQNFTRARRLLAECLKRRGIDVAAELA